MPRAADLPSFRTGFIETPAPSNPLGVKGGSESGTIGAPAAIGNAVIDALWHLGVRDITLPIRPETVWRALRDAQAAASIDSNKAGTNTVSGTTSDSARRIADELASCGVKLVASLPDNWLMDVINTIETRRPLHPRPGQSRGVRDRAVLGRLYGGDGIGRADGRVRIHDGGLRDHQDQLHLRDSAVPDGDAARRGRRPPQASHFQRALSAAGARCDQHAVPDHRQAGRNRADLALLSPHAHLFAADRSCCSRAICCAGAIDEIPRMLPRHRAASHRRDRGHVGGKFLPGVVGGDARLRRQLLSRRVDEPVDACLPPASRWRSRS